MKCKKVSECKEIRFLEFPDLLFSQTDEKDQYTYFDATYFLHQKKLLSNEVIQEFQIKMDFWINALCEVYDYEREELIVQDITTEHIMLEESLALLFIAYVEMEFAVYMLERIWEMLIHGMVLSDTSLLIMAKGRLKKEDLETK